MWLKVHDDSGRETAINCNNVAYIMKCKTKGTGTVVQFIGDELLDLRVKEDYYDVLRALWSNGEVCGRIVRI